MKPIVFLGPTVRQELATECLDAEYLPPAGHGDVYRAAARDPMPKIIAIIDGLFQSAPAVRHKEILWAMSKGVHVFGAASMGALRACELHQFGMTGIGAIYEAYRDGSLEDDDEVAVEHGPADMGYALLCEPMVNIRATIARAENEGVVSPATGRQMVLRAKHLFYKRRTYDEMIRACREMGVSEAELGAFHAWVPSGRLDQKRDDALALLRLLNERDQSKLPPFEPPFRFEEAEIWQSDMQSEFATSTLGRPKDAPEVEAILDELRLLPGAYQKTRKEALMLALATRTARLEGYRLTEQEKQDSVRELHREHALDGRQALEGWKANNHLAQQAFSELVRKKSMLRRIELDAQPLIDHQMIDALRMSGRYEELASRATRKAALIDRDGDASPMPDFQLLIWYFSQCLDRLPPTDPERFALDQGFVDLQSFYRALRREYWLRRTGNNGAQQK